MKAVRKPAAVRYANTFGTRSARSSWSGNAEIGIPVWSTRLLLELRFETADAIP